MDTLLEINNVACGYDNTTVIQHLDLKIAESDIVSFLGPSGCGKTTTLRAIAGFEPVSQGEIILKNRVISSPKTQLKPEQRNIGMVFQNYALFPHLTIQQNVAFGLNHLSKIEAKKLADQYLEMVDLSDYKQKMPDELSGGQQQRVALARTLATRPHLILMDEPFSNLDINLRRRLASQVREILKEEGITCILVTHDQEEAFEFSDKIGVFKEGQIQQWDTPFNIYHEPINRFVANFIGLGRFIRGTVTNPNQLSTEFGPLDGALPHEWPIGKPVDILVRPDDVVTTGDGNTLKATVVRKTFSGATTTYALRLSTGTVIDAYFTSHEDHDIGTEIEVHLNMDHLIVFEASV